jgi:hypothetical protein
MYYLINLKGGKVVKVSVWSEKERRDDAFDHYQQSSHKGKHFDEMQKFENKLDEYW